MAAALWALILALICAFWGTYGVRQHLIQVNRQEQRSLHRPILLNGLIFQLGDSVRPNLRQSDKAILFLSSDECRFSQAELREWTEFINDLQPSSDFELVFLSIKGHDIPARLGTLATARQLPNTVADISDAVAFQGATGITWTPEVVALDKERRVRIASERLTHGTQTAIRQFLKQ